MALSALAVALIFVGFFLTYTAVKNQAPTPIATTKDTLAQAGQTS